MSKGSSRRREDPELIARNWPFRDSWASVRRDPEDSDDARTHRRIKELENALTEVLDAYEQSCDGDDDLIEHARRLLDG